MAKLSLSDFKRSNMVLLIFVALAVLMFIFIPEFLGLASKGADLTKNLSFDLPKPKDSSSRQDTETVEQNRPVVDDGSSERLQSELNARAPLSQLEYLIDQGYIDYLVETKIQEQTSRGASKSETLENGTPKKGFDSGVAEFVPRGEITWEHLQSKESLQVLTTAREKSTELLSRIHSDFVQSRVALLSYIGALNQVSSESKTFNSPKEAIELLDRLDRNVTTTLAEERVPRAISADWAQISLAAVSGLHRADRLKQSLVPAYDPDPVIVHIVISRFQEAPHYGPSREAQIGVKFIVNGDEFKEAELERASIVDKIIMQKGKVRRFEGHEFPELVADWLKPDRYTLVVRNQRGEEYRKIYDLRAPPYDPRTWLFDQRSGRYFLRLPYGRPNSPQLFEARFGQGGAPVSSSQDNLFAPQAVGSPAVSTF